MGKPGLAVSDANIKGADQPVDPGSLISTCVVCCLKSRSLQA